MKDFFQILYEFVRPAVKLILKHLVFVILQITLCVIYFYLLYAPDGEMGIAFTFFIVFLIVGFLNMVNLIPIFTGEGEEMFTTIIWEITGDRWRECTKIIKNKNSYDLEEQRSEGE